MSETITCTINGQPRSLAVAGDRPLLWVLRAELGLTGTKYGCGEGHCGSCTVLVDGRAVRSCQMTMAEVQGKEVVTIEGLAMGDALHPVQQAFLDHDGLQCGYCTPGMIMQSVALLMDNPQPSREEILAALEDNLCRCGAHVRIVAAVEAAAAAMQGGPRQNLASDSGGSSS